MKIKTIVILALSLAFSAGADSRAGYRHDDMFSRRGHNIDDVIMQPLDGEAALRKEPGMIFHRRNTAPVEEQMNEAAKSFEAGYWREACKLYDTIVRSYPFSIEAPRAQENLAKIMEKRGKYENAFTEYCYLLQFYPEAAPVNDILTHMYAIANWNFGKKRFSHATKLFTTIATIAPGWERAADVYFKIGLAELAQKNYYEAADAFDTISVVYSKSPLAAAALEKHSIALYALSLKYKEDESIQRRALAVTISALKNGNPNSPDRDIISKNLQELSYRRDAKAFAIAKFYDTPRYKAETRIAAYEDFLRKCPSASQATEARRRLEELRVTNTQEK